MTKVLPKHPQITNLLDELSPEELEQLKSHETSTDSLPVDNYWLTMAMWLKIAGYQAYLDARDDARDNTGNLILTTTEVLTLIEATRKLDAVEQYKQAESSFIGAGSAQAGKKASSTFKSLTKHIIKQTKVEDGNI